MMEEKIKLFKKSVDRLTQEKDRLKVKLKKADEVSKEKDKQIQDFEMLRETLNSDRKRLDERLNKIDREEDFRNQFKPADESVSSV